ncbi:MAG: hypothetical protein GF390_02445 [Candidatus Pacebacteria bacterium]|nr:hypothetical protein [Candidatus Paceibacterota bacterium]
MTAPASEASAPSAETQSVAVRLKPALYQLLNCCESSQAGQKLKDLFFVICLDSQSTNREVSEVFLSIREKLLELLEKTNLQSWVAELSYEIEEIMLDSVRAELDSEGKLILESIAGNSVSIDSWSEVVRPRFVELEKQFRPLKQQFLSNPESVPTSRLARLSEYLIGDLRDAEIRQTLLAFLSQFFSKANGYEARKVITDLQNHILAIIQQDQFVS